MTENDDARFVCRICGNEEGNKRHNIREMHLGLREEFAYVECRSCGTLQIRDFPPDMSRHYPETYFNNMPKIEQKSWLLRTLGCIRNAHAVFGEWNVFGKALCSIRPRPPLEALRRLSLTRECSILDVGCGSGLLIHELKDLGFRKLLGIDPYLSQENQNGGPDGGMELRRIKIQDAPGVWDLIMFHHSFEHIPDPYLTLQEVGKHLAEDGCCVIRIPTTSSWAWRHYSRDWMQIDAPRHYFLYSVEGMDILCQKTGLIVEDIVYDSNEFQFIGSEKYANDIPLTDDRGPPGLTEKKIAGYKQLANELNSKNLGDQAIFYIRKTGKT